MDAGSIGKVKGWRVAEKKESGAEPAMVQPVMLSMTQDQLQQLLATVATVGGSGGIQADDIKAILDAQREQTRELVQSTRQVRHSNPDHLHISAFSYPEGDIKNPKPTLTRETFFNNHRESADDLTPAEILAYNAITHSGEARDGTWTARVKRNQLFVNVPSFTMDDRGDLPNGLVLILRELAEGPRAVDPVDMAIRIAALERQLADAQRSGSLVVTA